MTGAFILKSVTSGSNSSMQAIGVSSSTKEKGLRWFPI
jgi:hypothetical protein